MQRKTMKAMGGFPDRSEDGVADVTVAQGIGVPLERLIALLEGTVLDEAVALRHFDEAGSQLPEHLVSGSHSSIAGSAKSISKRDGIAGSPF